MRPAKKPKKLIFWDGVFPEVITANDNIRLEIYEIWLT